MAQKTLINGTEYTIKGGKTLVNNTAYEIKKVLLLYYIN